MGGGSYPTPGGSGGCDRIGQSDFTSISAAVLYHTPGDAGGSSYVHTFPVISTGCSVHSAYRSQFTSVAAEVSE